MEQNLGETRVHTEVFERIAFESAQKVPGVERIEREGGGLLGNLNLFGKGTRRAPEAGDEQEVAPGKVFDIRLILKHGTVIPQVARKVQEAVKEAIESMTEEHVAAVNIHVEGIAPAPTPSRQVPKTRRVQEDGEEEEV